MRLFAPYILWMAMFFAVNGQPLVSTNAPLLLQQLEESARTGQQRALRDLGSLLDRAELSSQVQTILYDITLFTKDEMDFSKPVSKREFLDFYYENEQNISFSTIAQTYYLSPLSDHPLEYHSQHLEMEEQHKIGLQLRQYIECFDQLVKQGNSKAGQALVILEQLCSYKEEEAYQYLLSLIQSRRLKKWKQAKRQQAYQLIGQALAGYQELESLNAILFMLNEKQLKASTASPWLSSISNIPCKEGADAEQLEKAYSFLVDSLGSLDAMHLYGYEQRFSFRINFFEYPVDYYGKLLSESDRHPWIQRNACKDLIRTAHPRALFYIAAHMYRHRNTVPQPVWLPDYAEQLRQLTHMKTGIYNAANKLEYYPFAQGDKLARRNFFTYWAKHYNDFEWDDNHNFFTNKQKAQEVTQNYERLFRRLNSKNDSVALKSFILITEGDPMEVIELADKYRQLLRTYNRTLPSFKHKYLEQLTLLTHYCKVNNLAYRSSEAIQQITNRLLQPLTPAKRYRLENELIKSIELTDLTGLEYAACIHEKNKDFCFSIGRVLDYYYSKHWDQIVSDDAQLLLFLKKSYLFASIGVYGSSNYYLSKFDIKNQQLQARLAKLYRFEADEDILNQIAQLAAQPEEVEDQFDLEEFLNEPALFSKRDIKTLPKPRKVDYRRIVKQIKSDDDITNIKQLFYYLRLHPHLDLVPYLFELVDDKRVLGRHQGQRVRVADNIVPSLEDIYDHSFVPEDTTQLFSTRQWARKWRSGGKEYVNWAYQFFQQKLEALQQLESLSIDEINELTTSQYFDERDKTTCLGYLKKVRPIKDIRKLHIEPLLNVEQDLVNFEDFFFGYKELDDIPKLFDIQPPQVAPMLNYLGRKSAKFSISEKGSFYNNLFRYPWFVNYIGSPSADSLLIHNIGHILADYLNSSEYLSEYEEQNTNLHIAQLENLGKPIEQQLQASITVNADLASLQKIQESILAAVSYKDLGKVAGFFKSYPNQIAKNSFGFLAHDFGLPIYDLDEETSLDTFIANHKSMSEQALYRHYLKAFGVDFLDKKGRLDFEKIYDMLEFDIVTPFVSRSGGKRDYYIYGIIKLLEFEFGDRLGFHEKLNENQTFYTFSSAKRAAAWKNFLIERKLVKFIRQPVSSFSHIRDEF